MINNKHILVTGGAGFIGSHLAARLIADGYKVTIADNLATGRIENVPKEAEFCQTDVSIKKTYALFGNVQFDAVFHLAGQSSGTLSFVDPLKDLKSHVLSTFHLLSWCKKTVTRRFLYASSTTVYGEPASLPVDEAHPVQPKTFYAAGKLAAEAYIRFFQSQGIQTTILRLPNVYGPNQNLVNKHQGMISIYLSYMLEGTPIVVKGSKERFRDFIYIEDVVDAWMLAFEAPQTFGQLYNLATGRKTTVADILSHLKKAFGNEDYPITFEPGTPGDQLGVFCDISKICNDLNWKPKVDTESGITKMVLSERRRAQVER